MRAETFSEPWRTTLLRTGTIALAIGVGIGLYQRHLAVVPLAALIALWFTLGGHFVELLFLNRLRHSIVSRLPMRALVRMVYWFAGGCVLYAGALATRTLLTGHAAAVWPWWIGGLGFVAIELVVHSILRARRLPNFYDGNG